MTIEFPNSPEAHELNGTQKLAWLAGIFEASGSIGFSIRYDKEGEPKHSTAYMRIRTKNADLLKQISGRFGGNIGIRRKKSEEWYVQDIESVSELARAVKPHLVSRREIAEAIENWADSDTDERLAIALETRTFNRLEETSTEDYLKALQSPAFTAGIVDAKGIISYSKKSRDLALRIYTVNKKLLEALRLTFGGSISIHNPTGTRIPMTGSQTKQDTYMWHVISIGARQIVSGTLRFLTQKPPENWNYSLLGEMQKQKQVENQKVTDYVRIELEQLKVGKLKRLSTATEIGKIFGFSQSKVSKIIRQTLSDEEQQTRIKFVYDQWYSRNKRLGH